MAFPVCVSVNDVICNNSPLGSEELVSSTGQSSVYLVNIRIEIGLTRGGSFSPSEWGDVERDVPHNV